MSRSFNYSVRTLWDHQPNYNQVLGVPGTFPPKPLNGKGELKRVKIDPKLLAPDEALKKARGLMAGPAYARSSHPEHRSVVDEVRQLFEQAYAEQG